MKINITAGDCLNTLLKNKHQNETFIPFREAMIVGSYSSKPFSNAFIEERAKCHNVSALEYKEKLQDFLDFLNHIERYTEVVLWFGDEPFCNENKKVILNALKEHNYAEKVVVNTVVEETGEVIKQEIL